MEMSKERLEDYRSKKAEIQELQYKLAHLDEGDAMIGHSIINDYQTGFPRPQAVIGFDEKKYNRLKKKYSDRLAELQKDCAEVEEWIEEIPDSLTRRIFRMYYIDGMTQQQVAKEIHMDRSSISKKIDAYFKDSHNSHYSHV